MATSDGERFASSSAAFVAFAAVVSAAFVVVASATEDAVESWETDQLQIVHFRRQFLACSWVSLAAYFVLCLECFVSDFASFAAWPCAD